MTSSNNDPPQSVVFIDSNVPDLQDLLSGLAPGVEAFVIDSSSNGLAQIAGILAANDLCNLSSISIVGHGAAGEVQVGATTLDAGDLSSNSAALAEIGAALAPDGQLQLYSCDTGSGAIGQQFIADLSQAAGVGVAAADQEIGQTASGENWTLGVTAGDAAVVSPAGAPFTAQAETDFQGTLTTDEWINTSGGTWTDTTHAATNWSLSALPTSTESVAIDQAGSGPYTVTIPNGAAATASSVTLSSANATLLDQGTLTLNGALTISAGTFQLSSTGTLSGVTSVSNAGTIVQGAQLTLGSGSSPATITNQAGGIYDITGAWGIGQGAMGSQFINQGTLERDPNGVNGVSYIDVNVTDTGTLNVPDNNPSGNNTNLRFDGANNSFSGTYIGGGMIDYGNPNDVGAGIDALGTINMEEGACTTSWATVNQNGVITLSVGSTIANYGTWNFTSDNGIELNIPQDYSSYAEFTNYGTLATTGSAGTTVMNLAYWNPYYAPSNYNYGGTGLISLAAGTTLAIDATGNGDIAAYFDNPIAGAGTFSIGGGGNDQIESGTSISSGGWTITGAGTDVTLDEALSYSGNFTEQSGATLTLASNLTLTGSASFTNATVNGSDTLTSNGTTTISGPTTLSGTAEWQAGTVAITDSLVVSNGTVFDATGSVTGSGSFTIQAGGKFEVGTALTQTLNFSAGGILDLAGINVQSAVVSGSTLTVTETNNSTLTFQTSLPSGDTFGFKSDGGTGTDLTVLPQVLSVGSSPANGAEDQPIALHFSDSVASGAMLTSFEISAIPVGATLTDGTSPDTFTSSAGNTSVDVHSWNLGSLTITPMTSNGFTLSALATAVDGSGYSYNATTSESVTVTATGPVVTAGASATFTGGGSPVVLDGSLTVSDSLSSTLVGATVAIGAGFLAGDTLNFTNQNGITGSYNSASGLLTLSGAATLAQYQTALDSITYNFTASGDPTSAGTDTSRTISWQVTDGSASSAAVTSTLTTVHAPPSVTASGTVTFSGGGSPVVLDGSLAVGDPDSGGKLAGATVAISAGFISGDTLNFTNQSGITGSYNSASGLLTLSGAATLAQYQTALDSITYSFTAGGDPTGGGSHTSRTISWQVTDGSASNGSSNTSTSALTTVHTAPSVLAGATATYEIAGSPVVLDGALTVSDADSGGNLAGATVSIGSGFLAGDALHFTNQNGITGSYNSASGVLTLSGATTLANYQTALDSITFSSSVASTGSRAIDWSVTDGVLSSSTATSSVTLATGPVVTAGASATFTGGGSPVVLDGSLTVSDSLSSTLVGATVAIGAGFLAGDTLNFTNQNGITGSYNSASGLLTLSGAATLAQYQTALDSITYNFTASGDPTSAGTDTSRTISWQVTDGSASSAAATSTLTTVHAPPSVTAGATATYEIGGSAATLDGALTVSDADSAGKLSGATVSISAGFISGDTLNFNTQNGITGSYNSASGVLTLSGTTTLANYQTALDSIAYSFTAGGDPTGGGSHTISWQVTDGSASSGSSNSSTSTLEVLTTPVVTALAANVNAAPSESFAASALFSASNAEGALILGYEVEDESTGVSQGFWVLNGAVLPSGQITELAAGQLSGLSFVSGSVASGSISDTLEVAASDAAGLGPFTTFTVTASHPAPGDVAPVITAANLQEAPNLNLVALSLFSASVPQGETVTSYEVEDTTSDSGHWVFNGVVEPANQLVDVTAAQLSNLSFETGYGTDTLMVRANDGTQWGTFATFTVQPPPNPPRPSGTTADMIMRDGSSGDYEIFDLGNNAILAAGPLGEVGLEWQVAGIGGFIGTDTSDMILRNSNTGQFEIYDVSNNALTGAAAMGQVGLEWTVAGFGDFSSRSNETDMLMRNSNTGAFEIYDLANNTITSAAPMGQVGLEWSVAGFGDFSTRANETDMLMRNNNTGAFEIYDISNNQLTWAAPMGQVGLEWSVAGFGDFSGDANETDMLMRNNNTGAFEIYDISNSQLTSAAPMGQVGLEWQVAAFGPINGAGTSDMLMRDGSTGAFEDFNITGNQLTGATAMGQVGLEWQVAGIAADPLGGSAAPNAQLVQMVASFDPAGGALDTSAPLSQTTIETATVSPLAASNEQLRQA